MLWKYTDIIIIVKYLDKMYQICYHLCNGFIRNFKYFNGGIIMDALKTVFATIEQVLNIIKEFFAAIFPQEKNDEEADA